MDAGCRGVSCVQGVEGCHGCRMWRGVMDAGCRGVCRV